MEAHKSIRVRGFEPRRLRIRLGFKVSSIFQLGFEISAATANGGPPVTAPLVTPLETPKITHWSQIDL